MVTVVDRSCRHSNDENKNKIVRVFGRLSAIVLHQYNIERTVNYILRKFSVAVFVRTHLIQVSQGDPSSNQTTYLSPFLSLSFFLSLFLYSLSSFFLSLPSLPFPFL